MKKYLVSALLVLTAVAGVLVAQSETATEEALAPEDCQGEGLTALKAEIDTLLATFEADAAEDPDTALAGLYAAGEAYRQLALDCGYLPEDFDALVVNSTDVPAILIALESLSGDPLRGQLLYNGEEPAASGSELGCAGCHGNEAVAPPTEGTWTRWDEQHRLEPQFSDYTFEQYTVESIILPWEYFVPTYPEYTMPNIYHEQLSYQDLADIVAYLNSQDQLIE
jgi:mono/diheme cytochrome c family protein